MGCINFTKKTVMVWISMRYELLTNIGGFLWWTLIKFCKTSLKSEQTKDKWSRNLFFLIFIGWVVAWIMIRINNSQN